MIELSTEDYQRELMATRGRGTCGILTKTLREMRIGQKWIVPVYVSMSSVKSICYKLSRLQGATQTYIVHNSRKDRSVICCAKMTDAAAT